MQADPRLRAAITALAGEETANVGEAVGAEAGEPWVEAHCLDRAYYELRCLGEHLAHRKGHGVEKRQRARGPRTRCHVGAPEKPARVAVVEIASPGWG
jgi:hypothetical protein